MATKNAAPATAFAVAPPTMVHTRLSGGLLLGTDNSLWLVRKVPLAPIADAKTVSEALTVAQPLLEAYEELAALAVNSLGRRNMSRNTYRETQLLLVNLKKLYRPDNRQPLQEFLSASFPDTAIEQRVLLFAVKLRARTGGGHGGLRGFLDSVAHTLVVGGTPMHDFDEDRERISALLARCGMSVPTSAEIALADSWWGQGRQPDTVNLSCDDHLHVFTDSHTVRMADDAGTEDCSQWREMRGVRSLTFATVEDFEFEYQKADESLAHWAVGLVDDGAAAVSIRALIEPAKITREELRRQRSKYLNDMREREKNGKLPRHEHEEKVATLDAVENIYATGGTPTLVDTSILVAFDGVVEDIAQVAPSSAAVMRTMTHRQTQALAEMMLCSKFRANPVLQDLPSQMIACSGIQSLNTVGDAGGALAGFTERDRQPAYVKSDAASQADGLPIMLVAGATGSGKTMLLLWLALQFSKVKRPGASGSPQIIVDPKQGSDHSPIVKAAGGQVYSLDDLAGADGVFDPLRFATGPTAVELAASMLVSIDPWGGDKARFERELLIALTHGVRAGADCIGQALLRAYHDGKATQELIKPIWELAEASPMFRACVGMQPGGEALKFFDGITLIKVGNAHLDLPEPGAIKEAGITQRTCLALVRMMVFGSAMALTGRGGAIHLDEAWVFLGAGKAEVERLGRLARSQNVLPVLYTQRVSDAVKAELTGYISRGLILPIKDRDEAMAACSLFKLEPTPERMGRITADAAMGGENGGRQPNWGSMRALRDPETGEVVRGAVAYYADLTDRAIPVEITLPQSFLALSSTNPEDIRRREEESRILAAAEAAARPDPVPVPV